MPTISARRSRARWPRLVRRTRSSWSMTARPTIPRRSAPASPACGFDEALRRCEDYDLYLRLALEHSVACHQTTIAEYRKHGLNMSNNVDAMLRTVLGILDRHATRIVADESAAAALRAGRVIWR